MVAWKLPWRVIICEVLASVCIVYNSVVWWIRLINNRPILLRRWKLIHLFLLRSHICFDFPKPVNVEQFNYLKALMSFIWSILKSSWNWSRKAMYIVLTHRAFSRQPNYAKFIRQFVLYWQVDLFWSSDWPIKRPAKLLVFPLSSKRPVGQCSCTLWNYFYTLEIE